MQDKNKRLDRCPRRRGQHNVADSSCHTRADLGHFRPYRRKQRCRCYHVRSFVSPSRLVRPIRYGLIARQSIVLGRAITLLSLLHSYDANSIPNLRLRCPSEYSTIMSLLGHKYGETAASALTSYSPATTNWVTYFWTQVKCNSHIPRHKKADLTSQVVHCFHFSKSSISFWKQEPVSIWKRAYQFVLFVIIFYQNIIAVEYRLICLSYRSYFTMPKVTV